MGPGGTGGGGGGGLKKVLYRETSPHGSNPILLYTIIGRNGNPLLYLP